MSTVTQNQNYYEAYWASGKETFSGSKQGYAPNFRRWIKAELSDLPPGAPVLDVGCGDASFTQELAKYSSSVTAVDLSSAQIAENILRVPNVTFLQHDLAEPFAFADATFDVIFCSEVLEHLFDPAFAVREMYRVLRPGGRLMFTVPYHGRLKNVLIALFKWDEHFVPSNPHIRFYTKNTLGALAERAGFRDIRMKTCGMGGPFRDLFVPTNILLRATK